MTLKLELTIDEEERLAAKARRAGVEPAELLRRFIALDDDKPYDPTADPTYSDVWSDEDMRAFTTASMQHTDDVLGEESGYGP
jgi:hypothetical protein